VILFFSSYSIIETNYNMIFGMIGLLVVCLSLVGLSYIVDLSYSFRDLFTLLFKIYNKYIKMYLQHSASVSSSCIVA